MVGEDWDEFSMSPEGDRQFANGPLRSTGVKCDDPRGCECQADLLSRWICPEKTCPIPACLEPIQPLGDCCLKCGAYLLYGFSSSTKIFEVEVIVKEGLEPENVYWHVGRTMGYIQVVIVEKEYSHEAGKLAEKLDQRLLASGLGLKRSRLESSGLAAYPGGPGQSILFFFISMIGAVALFTFFIIHYERVTSIGQLFSRNDDGRFSFARFENQSGAVQLGATAASNVPPEENPTMGFANPMYSEDQGVLTKRKIIPKDLGSESLLSSSEASSLSEAETEIIIGIPDQRNMEEIATGQLID
ncbi:protein amnionless [Halyomorpha halys]|uniref:protein amnionless n=1 Tax=Halyomorpha halys TaxID=286706 RepID=UPI0006D4F4BD